MTVLIRVLAMLAALLVGAVPALADHMNGAYSGTGNAAGTHLQLTQNGRTVYGQMTGVTQATLSGQSDGGDNVTGTIDITGVGQLQFQAQWSASGLALRLTGANGAEDYFFANAGTAPETSRLPDPLGPQLTPAPPPPPAPDDAEYYVAADGQQIGPLTLQQVLERIATGATTGDHLVWKRGLPDWTRVDGLAELAPALQRPQQPPPLPPEADGPPPLPPETGGPPAGMEAPTALQQKVGTMVFGAILGVLGHELGHALIGEFGLPSTGPEEDTADEFSALIMASLTGSEEFRNQAGDEQRLLREMVEYSSLLWFHDARRNAQLGQDLPWYDEHSDSDVRFRNTLCMIYGSAPGLYAGLADRAGFPERERGRCEVDFAKRFAAWETIIAPYTRNIDGTMPEALPADAPGAKLTVIYQESATAFGRDLKPALEDTGLFTEFAALLEDLLVWQRDFEIVFADCGTPNAFYDPSAAHIVMCWEGIEHFFWVIAEGEGIERPNAQAMLRGGRGS